MKTNLIYFYIYRIISRSYFHLPVLFVYFYIKDIPLLQIELLLAVYGFMLIISSKWNVLLGQRLKKKYVIALGEIIKAIGLVCFLFSSNILILIVGQILSGIGYSLAVGTDASLLRSLFSNEMSEQYKKVESSSNSFMFISFLLSGILGSIIFQWNAEYVFYFSIGANIIATLSIILITEKNIDEAPMKINQRINKDIHSQIVPENIFWKNYYALARGFSQAVFVGFLPYLFFITIKVNFYYFGMILSLFTITGFFSARFIIKLSKKIDKRKLAFGTVFMATLSIILFSFSENYFISIIAISLLGFSSGGVRPLTFSNLNTTEMSDNQRSLFFSSIEKLYGFWNVFLLIGGGILFYLTNFKNIMLLFAAIYVISSIFIFKKYEISPSGYATNKKMNSEVLK